MKDSEKPEWTPVTKANLKAWRIPEETLSHYRDLIGKLCFEQQMHTSSKLWSSQFWMQFKQLRIEAWRSQDFNGLWTCDLAIPVRCSNQLSYEATDVGSWSFVSSNEPVRNGCEEIIWNISYVELRIWNQVRYDHRSYDTYMILIILSLWWWKCWQETIFTYQFPKPCCSMASSSNTSSSADQSKENNGNVPPS